jgi:hypothetical protein
MARSISSTLTGVDGNDRDPADGLQEQIENMDRVQVGDGTYAYYPLAISRIEGMWAADMKPLHRFDRNTIGDGWQTPMVETFCCRM